MAEITDDQVVLLLPALAEAARATERTADRFVPPRTGVLQEAASRRHQLILGRRGVGKSTLLRRIEHSPGATAPGVIFVDIETLRGRPYPNVLIELLIQLLTNAADRLASDGSFWKRHGRARRRLVKAVRGMSESMQELMAEPQSAERVVTAMRSQTRELRRRGRAGATIGGVFGGGAAAIAASASASSDRSEASTDATEARFTETKMEGLREASVLIRATLERAQSELGQPTLLVLDDFYHIRHDDQPDVLSYLHQLIKNLDIYLKICGVRHRVNPFVEGDPPRGMQPQHDVGLVSLDITLERFEAAKHFLEAVLDGILQPLGIAREDILTSGGSDRLVLASGGVARDYISLMSTSLRHANERASSPTRPHNRVTAEDVNVAATELSSLKQDDLRRDAGGDADALRERLSDIVTFCLDVQGTNVFLVEGTKLQEETWGKQIQVLTDLRLVHQIATLTVKRGDVYRGRKYVAFTLDLSHWTSARSERIRQVEFWTTAGLQQVRQPALIYTADYASTGVPKRIQPDGPEGQLEIEFDIDEPTESDSDLSFS